MSFTTLITVLTLKTPKKKKAYQEEACSYHKFWGFLFELTGHSKVVGMFALAYHLCGLFLTACVFLHAPNIRSIDSNNHTHKKEFYSPKENKEVFKWLQWAKQHTRNQKKNYPTCDINCRLYTLFRCTVSFYMPFKSLFIIFRYWWGI